ncbi:MAG: 5'-methylthioadenosine/S-adenosylhomocysteine nucleosidase [Selenomonadaceae bacterium]|nr:5'-methylthioadenosine/S-adenosylhomocysteine nucleosidase [Selenomonadaceae bacterium]
MGNRSAFLIQGAMDVECRHIVELMQDVRELEIGKWYFAEGSYEGIPLVVCETQWGMANAAATTALAMERFHPCAVISQGTAGGHDPRLHTYDLVIGRQTVNVSAWKTRYRARGEGVDESTMEKLGVFAYDKEKRAFTQEVYHDCDALLFEAAMSLRDTYSFGKAVEGIMGTSDSWNCQIDRILFLHEFYGTAVEEMEGDAVAQICQTYDVPFLSIRVISNTVFEGDRDWDRKVGIACQDYVLRTIQNYVQRMGQRKG